MPTKCSQGTMGTVLLVANYPPDVGFAWWLMENFWLRFGEVAGSYELKGLIVYPEPGRLPEAIRASRLEIEVMPFPGSGALGLVRSLRLIRARRVRCIYLTDRRFTDLRYVLFRLAGVRAILNHDHSPGDRPRVGGLLGLLKMLWRRIGMASCDVQLCVSPLIRDRAVANARIPAARAIVVQNGINPIDCQNDRAYAHNVLGIPTDSSICMIVGRASQYKRIDFAIEVARRCIVDAGCRDLHFVHCGNGPDMDRLRHLAENGGLGDHFVFAGQRSDVAKLLCSAEYALHPAKGEAFSLAILEYMSAGLAVLVPDIPTVRQVIKDGTTGLVFRDGDAQEAAELLLGLHSNRSRAASLGAAAAEEVRRNYSLSGMNDAFRNVVSRVLAQHFVYRGA